MDLICQENLKSWWLKWFSVEQRDFKISLVSRIHYSSNKGTFRVFIFTLNLIRHIFCTFNMQQGNGESKHKHFRSLSLDTHHTLQMHFQSCNCLAISIVPDFQAKF